MRALVTGASRGIGRETAFRFLAAGYEVHGFYLKSRKEADDLSESGVIMHCCDVADKKQVDLAAKQIGGLDVLVNNAGVGLRKLFQCVSKAEEERLYGVNMFGALNVTRAFLQGMINKKSGSIINISSVFGEVGGSFEVDYSTSKAALIGFTKSLAKEVGPSCVRVNCVTPGVVETDMSGHLTIDDIRRLTSEIPLESVAFPKDIAETVFFLASPAASYITGAVIRMDGGWK